MKAIRFNATIPRYAFTLVAGRLRREAYYSGPLATTYLDEIPEPELVNQDWVKIKTSYGGVCGNDINMIFLRDTPYSEPFTTMPCTIGHENVGRVVEVGGGVEGFAVGDRVVSDPMLSCSVRGIDQPCEPCGRGDYSQCLKMREGTLPAGFYSCFCERKHRPGIAGGDRRIRDAARGVPLWRIEPIMTGKSAILPAMR